MTQVLDFCNSVVSQVDGCQLDILLDTFYFLDSIFRQIKLLQIYKFFQIFYFG